MLERTRGRKRESGGAQREDEERRRALLELVVVGGKRRRRGRRMAIRLGEERPPFVRSGLRFGVRIKEFRLESNKAGTLVPIY